MKFNVKKFAINMSTAALLVTGVSYMASSLFAGPELDYVPVTVQSGDTAWNLVTEHNQGAQMDVRDLLAFMEDRNAVSVANIQAGQTLYIPVVKESK